MHLDPAPHPGYLIRIVDDSLTATSPDSCISYAPLESEVGRLPLASQGGAFEEDSVGDWYFCLPIACPMKPSLAPCEAVGIDLGSSRQQRVGA